VVACTLTQPFTKGEKEHKEVELDFMGGAMLDDENDSVLKFEHFFQEHFDRATDLGYSAYASQQLKGDVVVTEDTGGGYVYDKCTATWVKRPASFITAEVTQVLAKPINLLYHIWDKYYPHKIESELDGRLISQTWKTANSYNNAKNVFKQACAALARRKNELLMKLDASSDSLPIMGDKVVCMRSTPPTCRTRTKIDYWSSWLPVSYTRQVDYPNAQKFVRSIVVTDEDEKKDDYSMEKRLQMMGGYWLTGETTERKLFNLTGAGRNGKTAFCSLFQTMLDCFYCVGHPDLFLKHTGGSGGSAGGAEPHKAILRGKRLVVLAETVSEDELNLKSIKEIVDNNDGSITARDLYEKGSGSTFKITAKMVVCSNPPIKYKVEAGDDAPGERIEVTEFPIKFDPPGEDKDLPNHRPTDTVFVDSLRNEHLSELFSYFVDGASVWYEEGRLPLCAKVVAATQKNIALNDTITGFIDAELVMDPGMKLRPEELWSVYCGWCGCNGRDSLSSKVFLCEMGRKLDKKRVGRGGATMYINARFKTEQEKDPEEYSP
jgi:hypothetical protein